MGGKRKAISVSQNGQEETLDPKGQIVDNSLRCLRPEHIRKVKLHRVIVTFNDVSGVVTSRTKYGTVTEFNFTANGRREYAVQICGAVCVESGMTVTAVLRDPNNWQTLEGWLNHQSGCIEGVAPIWSLRFAAILFSALFVVVLILSFIFRSGGPGGHALGVGMSMTFGLAALYPVASWHRGMLVWDELGAVKDKCSTS